MSFAGIAGIVVFLILIVLPLIGGILLIVFSRRRGPDHPACGACGYNVAASIDAGSRCPECGAEFAEVGITAPRGNRTRNPIMVGAGIVLIVVAVGCVGSSLLFRGARTASTVSAPPAPPAPITTTDPSAP